MSHFCQRPAGCFFIGFRPWFFWNISSSLRTPLCWNLGRPWPWSIVKLCEVQGGKTLSHPTPKSDLTIGNHRKTDRNMEMEWDDIDGNMWWFIRSDLVNVYITNWKDDHHFQWVNPLSMAIFNKSYFDITRGYPPVIKRGLLGKFTIYRSFWPPETHLDLPPYAAEALHAETFLCFQQQVRMAYRGCAAVPGNGHEVRGGTTWKTDQVTWEMPVPWVMKNWCLMLDVPPESCGVEAFHAWFASFHVTILTVPGGIQIEMKDSPLKPSTSICCTWWHVNVSRTMSVGDYPIAPK